MTGYMSRAQAELVAHMLLMGQLARDGWHAFTIGPHPKAFDALAMERVRKFAVPDTPHPAKIPWLVPPAFVERWARQWQRYHQETKHGRDRNAGASAGRETAMAEAAGSAQAGGAAAARDRPEADRP
jgi:predicted P-loop ATPase